jgi:Protein of unknown function (DUF2934)
MDPNITAEEIRNLIRERAYGVWESVGKPEGKEREHWLAAQEEVLEEVDRSGATGPADRFAREPHPHDPDRRQEDLVDEAIEETFPASDPISPKQTT